MATQKRGKASVRGLAGEYDVILYPEPQSASLTHNFDFKTVQDRQGRDCAWTADNENIDGDWMMKLLGITDANSKAGAAFLAPLAVITVSGADIAPMGTTASPVTWVHVPGSTIGLKNDDVGDITFKVKRYVDATQNTAFQTAPS